MTKSTLGVNLIRFSRVEHSNIWLLLKDIAKMFIVHVTVGGKKSLKITKISINNGMDDYGIFIKWITIIP